MGSAAYKKLPKQLIQIMLTDSGYVEYDPCDGSNPMILVRDDTLFNIGQIMHEVCIVQKVSIHKGIYYVNTECMNSDSIAVEIYEIIDPEDTYVVIIQYSKNHSYKLLMTAPENRHKYKFVSNPCPHKKLPEKEFKEIDFDALKRK